MFKFPNYIPNYYLESEIKYLHWSCGVFLSCKYNLFHVFFCRFFSTVRVYRTVKVKVKVKFTLEQATKGQSGIEV
jgi:hypothetical protein